MTPLRLPPSVYRLRVVFCGISPFICCCLLVRSDTTIAELHAILQVAFDWSDEHLHLSFRTFRYDLSHFW